MNSKEPLPGEESIFPELEIKFARFGARFGAALLDGLVLGLVTVPITYFNVITWKMPALFILTSLFTIFYKPFMEYQYGATLGKMAVGILVVGNQFQKVTLNEELRRVSFYLVPTTIQQLMTVKIYFSGDLKKIENYSDYNNYITFSNPALIWLNVIVFFLLVADCITLLTNEQNRSLHDLYAGTYVIEKDRQG
jgi:uncharacterized RDD family membrane protein YckC